MRMCHPPRSIFHVSSAFLLSLLTRLLLLLVFTCTMSSNERKCSAIFESRAFPHFPSLLCHQGLRSTITRCVLLHGKPTKEARGEHQGKAKDVAVELLFSFGSLASICAFHSHLIIKVLYTYRPLSCTSSHTRTHTISSLLSTLPPSFPLTHLAQTARPAVLPGRCTPHTTCPRRAPSNPSRGMADYGRHTSRRASPPP